jgi:hypothetical protein
MKMRIAEVIGTVTLSEGGEAAQPFRPLNKPVDAYNAAILDDIQVGGIDPASNDNDRPNKLPKNDESKNIDKSKQTKLF